MLMLMPTLLLDRPIETNRQTASERGSGNKTANEREEDESAFLMSVKRNYRSKSERTKLARRPFRTGRCCETIITPHISMSDNEPCRFSLEVTRVG